MIFDRTSEDIEKAKKIRGEKVQLGLEITPSDISALERGTFTIVSINRIEEKQSELKNLLNELGYWNTNIENKTWSSNQIFDEKEFQRIIDNENVLKNAFFVYKDTPITPNVSYNYKDINSIEKILYDLDVMINDVKSNYRECGTFECGEE